MSTEPSGGPDLARRISEEHAAGRRLMNESVAHMVEAGRLLTEAKGRMSPDEWQRWLAEEFPFEPREAKRLMAVYERRDSEEFQF